MRHRITNQGVVHLVVCDTKAVLHRILPGESLVVDFISIQHGDRYARYTVEPEDWLEDGNYE